MLHIARTGGALLLILSGVLAGLGAAREYTLRERELRDLLAALACMRAEIGQRLTPMPRIFRMLAQRDSTCAAFFRILADGLESDSPLPLSQLWQKAVRTLRPGPGADAAAELGPFLGSYEGEEECRAIARTEERLEAELAEAVRERRTRAPLTFRLCAAAGAGLAILLL